MQDYEAEYEDDPNAIEGLPASAADLLDGPYDYGFNCDQQDAGYGYYADVNNGCKAFHICVPIYNNEGALDRMDKYSFVCGEGTQFDQSTLTCNYPDVCFILCYQDITSLKHLPVSVCLPLRGEPEPVWCCRVWKDRGGLLSIVQRARLLVLVRTTEPVQGARLCNQK